MSLYRPSATFFAFSKSVSFVEKSTQMPVCLFILHCHRLLLVRWNSTTLPSQIVLLLSESVVLPLFRLAAAPFFAVVRCFTADLRFFATNLTL